MSAYREQQAVVKVSGGSLCSPAVVIIQHATKLLATVDLAFSPAYFFAWIDQLVAKPLMIPRAMVIDEIRAHRSTK